MDIRQIAQTLELPLSDFEIPRSIPYEAAVQRLEEIKKMASKQRKKLVMKYHPDIPETGSHEVMTKINDAIDKLNKIQIQIRRPQHQQTIIIRQHYGRTNNTTTTSTGGGVEINVGGQTIRFF